jgi:hypothetical protein
MFLEARAANCFSSTYVLKCNDHPIGKFEGRWFSEGLDISLTGRRQLRFEKVSWLSSQFVLKDAEYEDPVVEADRAGFFTNSWDLQLTVGPAQLVKAGWFDTGYQIEQADQVLGRVDRIGMCERGFQVDGGDDLSLEDLMLVGLVYHIIQQRQAHQHAAHHGGS